MSSKGKICTYYTNHNNSSAESTNILVMLWQPLVLVLYLNGVVEVQVLPWWSYRQTKKVAGQI